MPRTIPEWIGKTDDTPPPPRVKLRILRRQDHICALSKMPIPSGVTPHFDHIKRLADGGENRETNLQAVLPGAHKVKTAVEAKAAAKADAAASRAFGIKETKSKIPKPPKPKKEPYQPANGMSEIARRYGL